MSRRDGRAKIKLIPQLPCPVCGTLLRRDEMGDHVALAHEEAWDGR